MKDYSILERVLKTNLKRKVSITQSLIVSVMIMGFSTLTEGAILTNGTPENKSIVTNNVKTSDDITKLKVVKINKEPNVSELTTLLQKEGKVPSVTEKEILTHKSITILKYKSDTILKLDVANIIARDYGVQLVKDEAILSYAPLTSNWYVPVGVMTFAAIKFYYELDHHHKNETTTEEEKKDEEKFIAEEYSIKSIAYDVNNPNHNTGLPPTKLYTTANDIHVTDDMTHKYPLVGTRSLASTVGIEVTDGNVSLDDKNIWIHNNGIGIKATGINANAINNKAIVILDTATSGAATGMVATNGAEITNGVNGVIVVNGAGAAMSSDEGTITNNGYIEVDGTGASGISVTSNAVDVNSSGKGIGIYKGSGLVASGSGVIFDTSNVDYVYIEGIGLNAVGFEAKDGAEIVIGTGKTINTNLGTAMKATGASTLTNNGTINVNAGGIGMYANTTGAVLNNTGEIIVDGLGARGIIVAANNITINNTNKIEVQRGAGVVVSGEGVTLDTSAVQNVDVIGEEAIGFDVESGAHLTNIGAGTIAVGAGIGVRATSGSTVDNHGLITVDTGIGILATGLDAVVHNTSGTIEVNGIGGYGIYATDDATVTNGATINVSGDNGIGIYSSSTSRLNGKVINTGDITLTGNTIGIKATGSGAIVENTSNITVDTGRGIDAEFGSVVSDSGNITVGSGGVGIFSAGATVNNLVGLMTVNTDGVGIYAEDWSTINNYDGINVLTGAIGVYAEGKNAKINHENGTVTVEGNGVGFVGDKRAKISSKGLINTKASDSIGILVKGGAIATSLSEMSIDLGTGIYVEAGSSATSKGNVTLGNDVNARVMVANGIGAIATVIGGTLTSNYTGRGIFLEATSGGEVVNAATIASRFNVSKNIGLFANAGSFATNNGEMSVDSGIALLGEGSNVRTIRDLMIATLTNKAGKGITVTGIGTAMELRDYAEATNYGIITVGSTSTSTGKGISVIGVDSLGENQGTITVAGNGVGMYAEYGDSNVGIELSNLSSGIINANAGTGMETHFADGVNSGIVNVTTGYGMLSAEGTLGITYIKNEGTINVTGKGVAMSQLGEDTIENKGNISLTGADSVGMFTTQGTLINKKIIHEVSSTSVGMSSSGTEESHVYNGTSTDNVNALIDGVGTGIVVDGTNTFAYNYGTINMSGAGIGIVATGNSTADNYGKITVAQGIGMKAQGTSELRNEGTGIITIAGIHNGDWSTGIVPTQAIGMLADGSLTISNSGTIYANNGVGMLATNGATANNYGNIKVINGVGIWADGTNSVARNFLSNNGTPGDTTDDVDKIVIINGGSGVACKATNGGTVECGNSGIWVRTTLPTATPGIGIEASSTSSFGATVISDNYINVADLDSRGIYVNGVGATANFRGLLEVVDPITVGSSAEDRGIGIRVEEGSAESSGIIRGGNDNGDDPTLGLNGIGMIALGVNSSITNNGGLIFVDAGKGMVATTGATATNSGDIDVLTGIAMEGSGTGSTITNNVNSNITVASGGTGMNILSGATASNCGVINAPGTGNGMSATGLSSKIENCNEISIQSGTGMITLDGALGDNLAGSKIIVSSGGTGMYAAGLNADGVTHSTVNNNGTITIQTGTGKGISLGAEGVGNNNSTIDIIAATNGARAIYAEGADAIGTNNGTIKNNGTAVVMEAKNGGTIINGLTGGTARTLTVTTGKAMYATGVSGSLATATNSNTSNIFINGNGYGMYSSGYGVLTNNGIINNTTGTGLTGTAMGMVALTNATATNTGTIKINSTTARAMYANGSGAEATNNGTIISNTGADTLMEAVNNGTIINATARTLTVTTGTTMTVSGTLNNVSKAQNFGNIYIDGNGKGMVGTTYTTLQNLGKITNTGDTGLTGTAVGMMVGANSSAENTTGATIKLNSVNSTGMLTSGLSSTATNSGSITGIGVGMSASTGATATNKSTITIDTDGTGMLAGAGSEIINNIGTGIITVTTTGYGMAGAGISGSLAKIKNNANVYLNGNSVGMFGSTYSTVSNTSIISNTSGTGLTGTAIGMQIGSYSTATNTGSITLNSSNARGIVASGTSSQILNGGTITVTNGTGIETGYKAIATTTMGSIINVVTGKGFLASGETSRGTNSGTITITGTGYGMYLTGSGAQVYNDGTINVDNASGIGMYSENGDLGTVVELTNNATEIINANNGIGMKTSYSDGVNKGVINVMTGVGMLSQEGSYGIVYLENEGTINVTGTAGIGIAQSDTAYGIVENRGTITLTGDSSFGMITKLGRLRNFKSIVVTDSNSTGMMSVGSTGQTGLYNGTDTNYANASITGAGTAMHIGGSNAYAYNYGTINMTGTGKGIVADGTTTAEARNYNLIQVVDGFGMYAGGVATIFNEATGVITVSGTRDGDYTGGVDTGAAPNPSGTIPTKAIGMYGNGSGVIATNVGTINANGGVGMLAAGGATVHNYGIINVTDGGVGIWADGVGSTATNYWYDINNTPLVPTDDVNRIYVTGTGQMCKATNGGTVDCGVRGLYVRHNLPTDHYGYGYKQETSGNLISHDYINIADTGSKGIWLTGTGATTTFDGRMEIVPSEDSAYTGPTPEEKGTGIYAELGGVATNNGIIQSGNGIGMIATGTNSIVTNTTKGIMTVDAGKGIVASSGGKGYNEATIDIMTGIGMQAKASGYVENKSGADLAVGSSGKGMSALAGGESKNCGTITATGTGTGITGTDIGTKISNCNLIVLENGVGVQALNGATGDNLTTTGVITVTGTGSAMYASGISGTTKSTVTNNGTINVDGVGSKGVVAGADGVGNNASNIIVAEGGTGIYASGTNAVVNNNSTITVNGEYGTGVSAGANGNAYNIGTINLTGTGDTRRALYAEGTGAIATNQGTITGGLDGILMEGHSGGEVRNGLGTGTALTTVTVSTGTAMVATGVSGSTGLATNMLKGVIYVTGDGVGMYAGANGNVINNGIIAKSKPSLTYQGIDGTAIAIYVTAGGQGTNTGKVYATGSDSRVFYVTGTGAVGTNSSSSITHVGDGVTVMEAVNGGKIINSGSISISGGTIQTATGSIMKVTGNTSTKSIGENNGTLQFGSDGQANYGAAMLGVEYATLTNTGTITGQQATGISGNGIGMYAGANSTATNTGTIQLGGTSIATRGMVANGVNSVAINNGFMGGSGQSNPGTAQMEAIDGGRIEHNKVYSTTYSSLNVTTGIGMKATGSSGKVATAIAGAGTRIMVTASGYGMYGESYANLSNSGTISNNILVSGGLTGQAVGMYIGASSTATNTSSGVIKLNSDTAVGMYAKSSSSTPTNSTATNNGTISGIGVGMVADGIGATAINNGTITLTGDNSVAMYSVNGGHLINRTGKTINVSGGATAFYIAGGTRTLVTNEAGAIVNVATGAVTFKENQTAISGLGDPTTLVVFTNRGQFTSDTDFNADNLGVATKFTMAKSGIIEAPKVSGTIYVDSDVASNLYSGEGTSEAAIRTDEIIAKIKARAAMFEAWYQKNLESENAYDLKIKLRNYKDIVDNDEIADYLQANYDVEALRSKLTGKLVDVYHSGNKAKDYIFNRLNSAETKAEVNLFADKVVGNDFYPTVQKITNDSVSFMNSNVDKEVLSKVSSGDKDVNYFAGYNSGTSSTRETDTTTKYSVTSNSGVYGNSFKVGDYKLGVAVSFGATTGNITLPTDNPNDKDATYKTKNYQANLLVNKNIGDFELTSSPYYGISNGDITRKVLNGDEVITEADANYFGLENTLKKTYDFNTFYMTPIVGLSSSQITQDEIKENSSYGVTVEKTTSTSVKPSLELAVGKVFNAVSDVKVKTEVFGKYNYELATPNKSANSTSNAMDSGTGALLNQYEYNRSTGDIGARIGVSKGDLDVHADYTYKVATDDNEGRASVGIGYKF